MLNDEEEEGVWYIPWLEQTYGVILLCCFICGTVGNTLSLLYFTARGRGSSAQIYRFITSNDIVTSILMLPMSLSYFSHRAPVMFSNSEFCDLWGVLWNIIARYSIFLVAVLSISRTLSLFTPFFRLKTWKIVTLMCCYLGFLVLQGTVPFWRGQRYIYFKEYVQCFSLLGELFEYNSAGFIIFYLIFIQVFVIIFPLDFFSSFFLSFLLKLLMLTSKTYKTYTPVISTAGVHSPTTPNTDKLRNEHASNTRSARANPREVPRRAAEASHLDHHTLHSVIRSVQHPRCVL